MEMRSYSRLNLTRNLYAVPFGIGVVLSFHRVCGHERAISALVLYMCDGHCLPCPTLERGGSLINDSAPFRLPFKPTS